MAKSCAQIADVATRVWRSQRRIVGLFEGAVYPHCATDTRFDDFRIGGVEIGQILFVLALIVAGFLIPVAQ
jgi:hypothetical protein